MRRRIRRSAGHIFSLLREKIWKKRALENEIALTRLKIQFVTLCVLSFRFRRQNALRAALESGFLSARYAVQVALSAPAEYLTYGKSKQPQSISTTTPVYQRRI